MTDAESRNPDILFVTPEFPREHDASLFDFNHLVRVVRVRPARKGLPALGGTAGPVSMEFWCEWCAAGPVGRTTLRLVPMPPMSAD